MVGELTVGKLCSRWRDADVLLSTAETVIVYLCKLKVHCKRRFWRWYSQCWPTYTGDSGIRGINTC